MEQCAGCSQYSHRALQKQLQVDRACLSCIGFVVQWSLLIMIWILLSYIFLLIYIIKPCQNLHSPSQLHKDDQVAQALKQI